MPSSPVSPERLLALAAALEPLRETARAGAEEALGHLPEVGDRQTQVALDEFLEQLADTLRALDAEATELAARLRIAARPATRTASRGGARTPGSTTDPRRGPAAGPAPSPTHRRGLFR
jgi:hypothetical protein